MDLVVEMLVGYRLHGTATATSDSDAKAVFLPTARDILLQRVPATVTSSAARAEGRKSTVGDIEREAYSLQRYLEHLAEGQTLALEMLFAPAAAMLRRPTPLWRTIQANSHRLVTRRAGVFVRYCRQQASKYGDKGTRVAEARRTLAMLKEAEKRHGTTARLGLVAPEIDLLVQGAAHLRLVDIPVPGGHHVRHLEVCDRKMPFTASIKSAREVVERLVKGYGQRALEAERNEGVDWKAMSHAVRVGREALELLATGRIAFPLACAPELLAIKRGERPYALVSAEIELLLDAIEAAASVSPLPAEPDRAFIDDLVADAYRDKVVADAREASP